MPLLAIPQPYDFEVSTERFRAFGPDVANLWHEGGLHRVVGGREVRIEAAPGGVLVEPLDAAIEAEVCDAARPAVRPRRLLPRARRRPGRRRPGLRSSRASGRRSRPSPFESLVTSITRAAGLALRGVRDPQPDDRALRRRAASTPTSSRPGRQWPAADEDELFALGFSRRKAEYVVGLARADLDLDALAGLPDDEVKARLTAIRGLGEWTADWFLARHLARPRAWAPGDLGVRKAVRRVLW